MDKKISFRSPALMGILNLTPDSFFDGGVYSASVEKAMQQIQFMVECGVQIIDIGGESTRPGSEFIPEEEEINRVKPILEAALSSFKQVAFSIDTTKYGVAKMACALGVGWINDISGLRFAPEMADLAAEFGCGYMLMHSVGQPKTMQENPTYQNVVDDVYAFLNEGIEKLNKRGVQQIVIDPGIGFGKSLTHNIELIQAIPTFKNLGYPILIGASRKRMVGDLLDNRAAEGRLAGSLAVHYEALKRGADIIRVHDIQESMDILRVFKGLNFNDSI